ncbi:MAG: hypothetical protein ACOX4V_02430 [Anaerovoracaceae bacterium]
MNTGSIYIHGKGNKERVVYLENQEIIQVLSDYLEIRNKMDIDLPFLFVTKFRGPMSTHKVSEILLQNMQNLRELQKI